MNVEFITKEQNWQDGQTIYWFELDGRDVGTDIHFTGDTYGVVDSGGELSYVDEDGCPLTPGDRQARVVARHCVITDEMRED